MEEAGIAVIGAGPAGSVLAARLAQLGHDVCLVERSTFPRARLGESLTPGVLPLLETIGARHAIESAGFPRVQSVQVDWDQGLEERTDERARGLLVDRGRFDKLLLERARALGVRVLQPAAVRRRRWDGQGWSLVADVEGRPVDLHVAFLADASGRATGPGRRRIDGRCRTLALHAYFRGTHLPDQPRVEAGLEEWYWGVPLPDGTYNTLVFVDLERYRADSAVPLERRFRAAIDRSRLLSGCRNLQMLGRVRGIEATPYLADDSVTERSIKVGDAALAIDPISSSGVQKAIQTALAGAVVVNTLVRKPAFRDAALRFYRFSLEEAAERHRGWAAEQYDAVAQRFGGRFWLDRAAYRSPRASRTGTVPSPLLGPPGNVPVELSARLELVDLPCLEGDFVTVKRTVRHAGLDSPVAYLGGFELAPLLQKVRAGMTPVQLAEAWSAEVPLAKGVALAGWLIAKGILVPRR